MSSKNSLKNKALRRDQRDVNQRKQLKKRLASRVQEASFREFANEIVNEELDRRELLNELESRDTEED